MGKRRKLTKLIAMLMLTVFAVFIVSRNGSNAAPEGTGVSTLNALTSAVKNSAAKTGDDTPVALLIALAGVSVAAIVVCVILKIKKGKKKDSPGDESEE